MTVYLPQDIPRIGELLRERGWLSYAQILTVTAAQKSTGERFGEAAVRLGYVSQQQLQQALHSQWRLKAIAAVLATSIAVASPVAALAGSTATLSLMGYVRPTAAMQVERGHVIIPINGEGSTSEIEIIEKAPGAYALEIHSRSAAESGGSATLNDATGNASVPYELHYDGKPVLFSESGRAVIARPADKMPVAGRSSSLSVITRPNPGWSGSADQTALSDNITLTIRVQ